MKRGGKRSATRFGLSRHFVQSAVAATLCRRTPKQEKGRVCLFTRPHNVTNQVVRNSPSGLKRQSR